MLAALVVLAMASAAMSPEQVIALVADEKYSDALREGKKAVELEPGSARAHFAYGVVLRNVYRRAEAVVELERALELAPADAAIAIELGWALAETGDLARAKSLASEAARAAPEEAAELQNWLDREVRIRNGPDAAFPPGSASEFVAKVIRKLRAHRVEAVFREDFDRAFLDRWAKESTIPSSSTDAFISRLAGELEEVLDRRSAGASLRGYEVAASPVAREDRTYVAVLLVTDSRFTPAQIATFEKWVADPSLPVPMNDELARVLRSLEPADQLITIAALGKQTTLGDVSIEFELKGRSGAWKITDVMSDGARLSSAMGVMKTLVERGAVEDPRRRDRAYEIGKAVGRLLGVLLVIALGVALWRRHRRRR